jgi:AraC-like DNA-binding protein
MQSNVHRLSEADLDYESWRSAAHAAACCRHTPRIAQSKSFVGQANPGSLYGLRTVDIGLNVDRVDRTPRDIRLDDADYYYAVIQTDGESSVTQNDRTVDLTPGTVALIDVARPLTYAIENASGRWRTLHLPRQAVVTHLGFEPRGGVSGRKDTHAGRILVDLLTCNEDEESMPERAKASMQLVIYDLLSGLFAPSDQPSISTHTDRLFGRVCDIIQQRFSDPGFGLWDIAAELKISPRYLQKLFAARGLACNRFVQSVRLDHAAHLLHRRTTLNTRQPLSEIAYACGFNDYRYFSRRFRQRFGHSPSLDGTDRYIADAAERDAHDSED